MSDEQQQAVTQAAPSTKKSGGWYAIWVVFTLILFGVFGILGVTKWMQLNQQLRELKEMVSSNIKLSADHLKPLEDKLTQLSADQTTQQTTLQQQSETLSAWKEAASGNVDRWYIAEARYLVKLAQFEVGLSRNYLLVNGYLEKAQSLLEKIADPRALEMRNALKLDQEQVLKLASSDTLNAQFEKLAALDKQIDALPLPAQTIKPVDVDVLQPAAPMSKAWWEKGLQESAKLLKEIVVIKKINDHVPPFILPEDKIIMQANLHLQLQHAMDGLLRTDSKIYAASLQQAMEWVDRYFKKDDPTTMAWLEAVKVLSQIDLSALQLDVSHAVPLFDAYLNQ